MYQRGLLESSESFLLRILCYNAFAIAELKIKVPRKRLDEFCKLDIIWDSVQKDLPTPVSELEKITPLL